MTITAALAWWCEPIEFLDRMVASLAGVADELVALDGAWEGVPFDGRPLSTPQEHDAIANACIAAGISYRIPDRHAAWKSQLEKRAKLMELAGENGDWILVIDGDETIGHCDAEALRKSLDLTDRHGALATITPLNTTWPYNQLPTRPYTMPRLFRRGTVVEMAHNGYRHGGDWLLGDRAYVRISESLDLSRVVFIDHDNANRDPARVLASKSYSDHRRRHRTEEWAR